jgi:hypothetical protein
MFALLILAQAVQPQPAAPATTPPDIQLDIRATARRVVIQNEGKADLQLRTSLNGRAGEGNVVEVDAPEVPEGRRELNNVTVRVRAEARIPHLQPPAPGQEPPPPQ